MKSQPGRISALLFLSLLIVFSIVLSNCAYITGEAIENTPLIPRWVWSGSGDSIYSIVIDRYSHQPIKDVTPDEAFGIIRTSQYLGNPVILDVRTPEEYAAGHIRDAINMNLNSPTFKDEAGKLDKNKLYLIYCRSGSRSAAALDIMEELGFKNVINMTNGFSEWQVAGLPIEP